MNPLSSLRALVTRSIQFVLAVSFLIATYQGGVQIVNAQPVQLAVMEAFDAYGFDVIGFTPKQEEIIASTLAAYTWWLGGKEKLRKIITRYNHGQNWKISYAPGQVGANSEIKLSPTVFSLQKSIAANFSNYGAVDETTYTQIVIGHEIGHLLVHAAMERSGINWPKIYEQRVERDWASIHDRHAPEEEAVTELSLKVLRAGYYFSLNAREVETNPVILYEIKGWTADFLQYWNES